ncbi:MAG: DMT family protein [Bdellovibrionota bacterium]
MSLGAAYPLLLLVISNVFMTWAWYGHLKTMNNSPLWMVILISWGIAFFEYCFQVPANRYGFSYFTLPQLKIIQEVITILVFIFFSTFYMQQSFKLDYLWAGLCMVGAVYFVFR